MRATNVPAQAKRHSGRTASHDKPLPYVETESAELISADTALNSFRDGGYTLADAIGEMVDNAIESGAKKIRIAWILEEVATGRATKKRPQVISLAVADDGHGIPATLLPQVMTIGFSTRYGSRTTIGRFGVGFKLGALSQGKRLDVYTRPSFLKAQQEAYTDGSKRWRPFEENMENKVFRAYFDLKEISEKQQTCYRREQVPGFPPEFANLFPNEDTGTLMVLSHLDRLNYEPSYALRVDEKLQQLTGFLARAYRRFIDNGLQIFVQDQQQPIPLHDPTFQLANPVATRLFGNRDLRGERIDGDKLEIDGHSIEWVVTLAPDEVRLVQGEGGERGEAGAYKELRLRENLGKVSFLRQGREISYASVPWLLPRDEVSGRAPDLDRFIGLEVSFPPALDEYFQVKHIKRGAEPVDKLKQRLRDALEKPVLQARKVIRARWAKTDKEKRSKEPRSSRIDSEKVARRAETSLPPGAAGQAISPSQEEQTLCVIAQQLGIVDPEQQNAFVQHARQQPITSIDSEWPGKSLLDIEHLSSTVVVRINRAHDLIQRIYQPMRDALAQDATNLRPAEVKDLLKRACDAIDLVFFAYAKAENMHKKPEEAYGDLRSHWGHFLYTYIRTREAGEGQEQ